MQVYIPSVPTIWLARCGITANTKGLKWSSTVGKHMILWYHETDRIQAGDMQNGTHDSVRGREN